MKEIADKIERELTHHLQQGPEPTADVQKCATHDAVHYLLAAELVAPTDEHQAILQALPRFPIEGILGVLPQILQNEVANLAIGTQSQSKSELRQVVLVVQKIRQQLVFLRLLDLFAPHSQSRFNPDRAPENSLAMKSTAALELSRISSRNTVGSSRARSGHAMNMESS